MTPPDPLVSIIIPALDEADAIVGNLAALQPFRDIAEIILVDGGSTDATVKLARGLCDRLICCGTGRARQMNRGARGARGAYLLFLHADTCLPPSFPRIIRAIARSGCLWGRFDIALSGDQPIFRVIAFMMNLRSRLTGIATGDQAIFMARAAYRRIGGFPEIALMEDIAVSVRLKALAPPRCLRHKVLSSSRRWQRQGIARTVIKMWYLRLLYFFGADPGYLARQY